MRRLVIVLAAMAVMVAGCQDKPVDPMKPKVGPDDIAAFDAMAVMAM